MKKLSLSLLAFLMAAVVCVGFASCGDDDDNNDGGLGLSEAQIREYLESGSGRWSVIEIDDEDARPSTWYFQNGKTNGWGGNDFSMWGTPYTVSGSLIYITSEDAKSNRGDVLEGGIVLTKLTNTTMEFYWKNDSQEKYIGTKQ